MKKPKFKAQNRTHFFDPIRVSVLGFKLNPKTKTLLSGQSFFVSTKQPQTPPSLSLNRAKLRRKKMGKVTYKRLKGSQNMRLRLLLATLKSTPIIIEDIHDDDTLPGLRPHEISLLRLFEKVTDDCLIEINETGNTLFFF